MTITAEAVPVYLALIGLVTLIVQGIFAAAGRAKSTEKLNEIHTLTNSTMSEVRAQLSTAMARIEELNKAAFAARLPANAPIAIMTSAPAAVSVPSSPSVVPSDIMAAATLTGIAAAATSVADAAVEKKDEIVGPKK